jgi:lipopolysaccharide/colanic/teichoic acid biosynthesis glycosyltransferase
MHAARAAVCTLLADGDSKVWSLSHQLGSGTRLTERGILASIGLNGLRSAWPDSPTRRLTIARGWSASAGYRDSDARERGRRGLNVAAAAVGLVLAAPLMLLVAAAIRLTSRGPAFYRQTRVGIDRRALGAPPGNCRREADLGGRPFTIYKFRTMRVSGNDAAEVWARPDDPRITLVGRILRKYRLDELPQLVNVLLGDMNLVGPRPEQPEIFQRLRESVEEYPRRQQVLPGITGWAQVKHRYDTSIDDVKVKVGYDLEYIERCSATQDLKIMALTVPTMVLRRGAL